ncbi:unnamed protein product, partial [Rotaria sordida]
MMIGYYKLKVPSVIFKREKEIARKLEFEGAWLIDQPTFPDSYWDKFVKKEFRNKYSDQFDYDELSRFL